MKFLISLVFVLSMGMTAKAAVIGNRGVQVMEYLYDFSVHGGAVGFIDLSTRLNNKLPAGATILRVHYYVQTAFTSGNSGGSATIGVGDDGSNARYLAATAYDNAAWADENLAVISSGVPNVVESAAEGKVGIVVGTAALTAGKVSILVEYTQVKR